MKRENNSSMAYYRNILADCCENREFLKAILISEKIISMYENETKNENYAEDIYNIACIYMDVRKFREAGELLEDIEKKVERKKISDRVYVNILNSKALCSAKISQPEAAENYLNEAFEILNKNKSLLKNPYVVKLSVLFRNMGSIKLDLKKYDEAIQFFTNEIALIDKKSIECADASILTASAYAGKEMYDESIIKVNDAINIIKKNSGIDSKEYMELIYFLGEIYYKKEDYNNAFACFEKTGELVRKFLSEKHPYHAEVLNKLSNVYIGIGDIDRAIYLRQRAMNIIKNSFGDLHIYYIYCLEKLALSYKMKGDNNSAVESINKVLEIKEKINGRKSETYVRSLLILYNLYMEVKDFEGALEVLKDAAECSEKMDTLSIEVRLSKAELFAASGSVKKCVQLIKLFCRGKKGLIPQNFMDYLEKSEYVNQNELEEVYDAFNVPYENRKEKVFVSDNTQIKNEITGMFDGKPINNSSKSDKILGSIIDIITAARKNNVDLTKVDDFMGTIERITGNVRTEGKLPDFEEIIDSMPEIDINDFDELELYDNEYDDDDDDDMELGTDEEDLPFF